MAPLCLLCAEPSLTAVGPGESVRVSVNLTLANHVWAGQEVTVMNLDDLQEALGVRFDGLLGQDVLREFRTVLINYRARRIELEE